MRRCKSVTKRTVSTQMPLFLDESKCVESEISFTTFKPLATSSEISLLGKKHRDGHHNNTFQLSTLSGTWEVSFIGDDGNFNEGICKRKRVGELKKKTQPASFPSKRSKLTWIQQQRDIGLYVICDKCKKMRWLETVKDPLDLPKIWTCNMNPDKRYNSCAKREQKIKDRKSLISNRYNAGSVVWAKVTGHAWWPAIVDDDPDFETYFSIENEQTDEPAKYHVTFFGDPVQRAWCTLKRVIPFKENINRKLEPRFRRSYKKLNIAKTTALTAVGMPLARRLARYSFLTRWPGRISGEQS